MVAAAAIVRAAFASGAAPPPGRLRACSRCHGEGGLYTRGKRRSGGAAAVIRRPCAACGGIGLVDGMLPPPRHEPGPRDRAFVGTVAIAGGGIGGAAAALALQQRGFRVVVYERDSNFDQRAQGYGLTMQQGATALAQLGLPNEGVFSYAHSSFLPDGTLLGEYGRGVHESTRERMGNGRGKAQRRNAHIPRQALRAALLDPLLPGTVRWGKAIARFDAGDSGVILHFEDGSPPERAALLVGADGIRSRVREQLLGAAPLEYLGVVVVLGRSRTSHAAANERVFQTLDGDTRLYVMPFEAGVAMWQLSFRLGEAEARAIQTLDGASLRALALRRHEPIPQLLQDTAAADITGYPAYDRPCPAALRQPTSAGEALGGLGGEAGGEVPPPTLATETRVRAPVAGGGGGLTLIPGPSTLRCQALLDGIALARALRSHELRGDAHVSLGAALSMFEADMLERARRKVRASRDAAELLHSPEAMAKSNSTRARSARDKRQLESTTAAEEGRGGGIA
ncbi:hypothetical protein EMIHUDRAFT_229975 [Emiliania huxleyi CCMP1516]|uniref:FAD-binding domain-containing protein n=2 Tax=Emiliania huxleyi TaxID=2903 RepID=A0A0D3KB86_EMIH1|nr:hypothetical protein EMIHUDRAFT_229975 [Emiliania huxleyi CCMP1516]EOD33021.1 hypothetical protein EMIHUDRAFT_229975 [Emiliania huxleyi CCMP1516]|eukprot:XP_005785450.1 hypothetical protein EMIHUDRAFT_229975 [Emiliania huxleyi CCMP1516]